MNLQLSKYIRVLSAIAVLLFCVQMAFSQESPFPPRPFHLVNITKQVGGETAFPNVMLLVDDSGSMRSSVPPREYIPCQGWRVDAEGNNDTYCRYYINNRGGWSWDSRGTVGASQYYQYRDRMMVVKDALMDVLRSYDPTNPNPSSQLDANGNVRQMHWNLMTLCGTIWGSQSFRSVPASTNGYLTSAEMQSIIPRLRANCGTATTKRYIQAAEYAADEMNYKCQKNFIVTLSDGGANQEGPNNTSDYSNFMLKDVYGSLPSDYDPYGGDMGDGMSFFSYKLKNMDFKTTPSGYQSPQGSDPKTDPKNDVEGSPWDGKQNIETYTVGFGNLSGRLRDYLEHGGAADDVDNQPVRTYFTASNSQELIDAFESIFNSIADKSEPNSIGTTSITTPANAGSQIDAIAATLTLDTGIWSSEFRFNKLDASGQPLKDASTGEYKFSSADYISKRKFIINNGSQTYWLDNTANINVIKNDFGFRHTNELRQGFLPWIMRSNNFSDSEIEENVASLNLSNRDVEEYRVRTDSATDDARQMGDVLDSSILAIGKDAKYLMTGANDGMVYFFQSTSDEDKPYELVLNYIPAGMERESSSDTLGHNMKRLAEKGYGLPDQPHMYGVNGGITYVKTSNVGDRHQRSVVLGAMGQGARGVYAFNIEGCERDKTTQACQQLGLDANPANWDIKVPLWESEKGVNNLLGYTVGKPVLYPVAEEWSSSSSTITPTLDEKVFLAGFVANGYQAKDTTLSYDDYPTLYIYNALGDDLGTATTSTIAPSYGTVGEVVKKLEADSADGQGALASPAAVDIDYNGVVDVVYAGDIHGDMYRFDLRGNIGDWEVTKIYDGDASQPITAAPAIYRDNHHRVVVSFGTGSDLFDEDREDTKVQGFFGIYDDLNETTPTTLTINDLSKREFTSVSADNKTIEVAVSPLDETPAKKGWWIELAPGQVVTTTDSTKLSTSEKVVSQPKILINTVFFVSRIYESSISGSDAYVVPEETCKVLESKEKTSGTSWLMALDVRTGGQIDPSETASIVIRKENGEEEHSKAAGINLYSLASAPGISGGQSEIALNADGQVGDGLLTIGKSVKLNNTCVTSDDYQLIIALGRKTDPLFTPSLSASLCVTGNRLIRINTREIN